MLYTVINLHSAVYQLYFNKTERKKQREEGINTFPYINAQNTFGKMHENWKHWVPPVSAGRGKWEKAFHHISS